MDSASAKTQLKYWYRFSLFGQVYIERNGTPFIPPSAKQNARKELRVVISPFPELSRVELWHMNYPPPGLSAFVGSCTSVQAVPQQFIVQASTSGGGPFLSKPMHSLKSIYSPSDASFVALCFETVPEGVGAQPYSNFVSDVTYTPDMAIKDTTVIRLSEFARIIPQSKEQSQNPSGLAWLWKHMHQAAKGPVTEINKDDAWGWIQTTQRHIIRNEVDAHMWGARRALGRQRVLQDRNTPTFHLQNSQHEAEVEPIGLSEAEEVDHPSNSRNNVGRPRAQNRLGIPSRRESGIFSEIAAVQRGEFSHLGNWKGQPHDSGYIMEGKHARNTRVSKPSRHSQPEEAFEMQIYPRNQFTIADDFVCYDNAPRSEHLNMVHSDSEEMEIKVMSKLVKGMSEGSKQPKKLKPHAKSDTTKSKEIAVHQDRQHSSLAVSSDKSLEVLVVRESKERSAKKHPSDHKKVPRDSLEQRIKPKTALTTREIDLTESKKPERAREAKSSAIEVEERRVVKESAAPRLSKLHKGYEAPKNLFCRFPEADYPRLLSFLCPLSQMVFSMTSYGVMRAVSEKVKHLTLRPGAFWTKFRPATRQSKSHSLHTCESLSIGRVYLGRYSLEEICITPHSQSDSLKSELPPEAWDPWFEKVVLACTKLKSVVLPWDRVTNKTLSTLKRKLPVLESLKILKAAVQIGTEKPNFKAGFDELKLVELFEEHPELRIFEIHTLGVDVFKCLQSKLGKSQSWRDLQKLKIDNLRMPFQLGLNSLSVLSKTSPGLRHLEIPRLILQKPIRTKQVEGAPVMEQEFEPPVEWTSHLVSLSQVDAALPSALLGNLQSLTLSPVFTAFNALNTCIFPALKKAELLRLSVKGQDPGQLVEGAFVKLLDNKAKFAWNQRAESSAVEEMCPKLKWLVVSDVQGDEAEILQEITAELIQESVSRSRKKGQSRGDFSREWRVDQSALARLQKAHSCRGCEWLSLRLATDGLKPPLTPAVGLLSGDELLFRQLFSDKYKHSPETTLVLSSNLCLQDSPSLS